ncbi:MAG: 50S ribosomal protein L15 [Candidatus Omnitrophica bacterium]|nr:50S ribosomal protein L15 [Candidatus Omnitrophota bacterium]
MITLSNLHAQPGARKKIKRRGRGNGSGHGKTSCRGHKGLFSRSGGSLRHGFEGGQMPLIRRVPKRGFTGRRDNIFQVVNLDALSKIKNKELITPEDLSANGLIRKSDEPIKVLGGGEVKKALTVKAHAFSKSAIEKIKSAGGRIEIIGKVKEDNKAKPKKNKKEAKQE